MHECLNGEVGGPQLWLLGTHRRLFVESQGHYEPNIGQHYDAVLAKDQASDPHLQHSPVATALSPLCVFSDSTKYCTAKYPTNLAMKETGLVTIKEHQYCVGSAEYAETYLRIPKGQTCQTVARATPIHVLQGMDKRPSMSSSR